jgi:hypothetical protein
MSDEEQPNPLQRRPLHLQDWDSWLDKTIAEAEDRGEFENLPGHGKPIQLAANPLTGEVDVGHGILKSAGMAPAWIELDKDIRAGLDALANLRDETARRLTAITTRPPIPDPAPAAPRHRPWWRRLLGQSRPFPRSLPPHHNPEDEWARARAIYLERAHELDSKIASFNATLPTELWHLERRRLTPERAARDFDTACPRPGEVATR